MQQQMSQVFRCRAGMRIDEIDIPQSTDDVRFIFFFVLSEFLVRYFSMIFFFVFILIGRSCECIKLWRKPGIHLPFLSFLPSSISLSEFWFDFFLLQFSVSHSMSIISSSHREFWFRWSSMINGQVVRYSNETNKKTCTFFPDFASRWCHIKIDWLAASSNGCDNELNDFVFGIVFHRLNQSNFLRIFRFVCRFFVWRRSDEFWHRKRQLDYEHCPFACHASNNELLMTAIAINSRHTNKRFRSYHDRIGQKKEKTVSERSE